MNIRETVLSQLERTEYISFDIYDTLLFRMVRFPSQIFEKTYEKAPELFPDYITPCEWEGIRVQAERCARERWQGGELTLTDIYAALPKIIKEPDKIMRAELETEKENTFLNPETAKLLYELKEKYGKRIILTSDMYLSEDELRDILEFCGMDMSFVKEIFVSSAWGMSKKNGGLYKCVREQLHCLPEQILHIGDNWTADYVNAKRAGWKSVYYPLISEAEYRYPYLGYERECYGDIGREIYTMRLMAAECHDRAVDEKDWFEMGAMTMGPLFTYAAEWVLDLAEQYDIHNIYPIMREGHFLTILLKDAAKERGWKGRIEPMYISRRALYPALLSVLKKSDVQRILNTKYITVKKILELFDLNEAKWDWLRPYQDYRLEDCRDMYDGDICIEEKVRKCLLSENMIQHVRIKHKDADEGLWAYLTSLKVDREDYITFDVGWKGSTQNALERLAKKRGAVARGLHLLVIGRESLLKNGNLEDGADIRGYISNFGESFRLTERICEETFEMFLMCREGATTGYALTGEEVCPVCAPAPYEEAQNKKIEAAQAGIHNFQRVYFSLRKGHKQIAEQKREELLKIAARLSFMPTRKEAGLIGSIRCEENLAAEGTWELIDRRGFERYVKLGYNTFTHAGYARPIEWYQGMDALADGLVYYKNEMFRLRNGIGYQYAMYAERICRRFKRFALVGAGARCRTLFMALSLMNEMDRVEFVADNDAVLQGDHIYGKEIYPLSQPSVSGCYVITPMNRAVIQQLREQLRAENEEYRIYDVHSREENEYELCDYSGRR